MSSLIVIAIVISAALAAIWRIYRIIRPAAKAGCGNNCGCGKSGE